MGNSGDLLAHGAWLLSLLSNAGAKKGFAFFTRQSKAAAACGDHHRNCMFHKGSLELKTHQDDYGKATSR